MLGAKPGFNRPSLARVDVDLSYHEVKEVSLVAGWHAPDVALPVAQLSPSLKFYSFLDNKKALL